MARSTKKNDKHHRALDPACGSGNFLYLALKCLKDIEHHSHLQAAELARVTVWIGELQWRIDHGYEFKTNPVLEPLDHIECRDALLTWADDKAMEADWPAADAVVGNPPFLGGSKKRGELGATYFDALVQVFSGHVPGGADLVCYWFDKARKQMLARQLHAAGLVATQAIRAGSNRAVLSALQPTKVQADNPSHEHHHIRHSGPGDPAALGRHSAGTGGGGGESHCREPGQLGDRHQARRSAGPHPDRSGGAQVDAGGHAGRRGFPGTEELSVTAPTDAGICIFNAWADEPWVNDGAAVRVSLVCFGTGQQQPVLNGQATGQIHAVLSSGDGLDLTQAKLLPKSAGCSFKGPEKTGAFDIPGVEARKWLAQPNPNGRSNSDVLLPWHNGSDITGRCQDQWVIDFGVDMTTAAACLYEAPFAHVESHVKPERINNNDRDRRENWWRFGRNGADMRKAVEPLLRFIVTPRVAKHRFFAWLAQPVSPDSRLNVIARADDTTFGVLSSRIHEVWSLAQASIHGDGAEGGRPTYNAKSCFETFPFPPGLSPADTAHQRTEAVEGGALIPADLPEKYEQNRPLALDGIGFKATTVINPKAHATPIAQAAKRLNDLRQAWLNPPEWTERVPEVVPLGLTASPYPDRTLPRPGFEKQLAERTLTKLYNQRPAWLAQAHAALDAAVATAYDWADYTLAMADDEILNRLLALNLATTATPALS